MPSERFLSELFDPDSNLNLDSIGEEISCLGTDRLSSIILARAQYDKILREILIATISLRQVSGDLEKAKEIVDKAIDFPEGYVRYTEQGHEQILDEIRGTLEILLKNGEKEFALRVAEYTVNRSESISDIFEDDWEWTESVKNFIKWIQDQKTEKN